MIARRGPSGVAELTAQREHAAARLIETMKAGLARLDDADLPALYKAAFAALDRIAALDGKLSNRVPSPRLEIRDARATIATLTWALALMPPGCPEAAKFLRGGIDSAIRRLDRAQTELQHYRQED